MKEKPRLIYIKIRLFVHRKILFFYGGINVYDRSYLYDIQCNVADYLTSMLTKGQHLKSR